MLRKFVSDEQVKMLLYALQNGSVITDDGGESIGRRKTMFVEDFPIDLILDVLKELVTPVSYTHLDVYKRQVW